MRRHHSNRSASKRSRARKTHSDYCRKLAYEALEDRNLLAITGSVVANVLTISFDGAANDSAFIFNEGGGSVRVTTDVAGTVPIANSPFAGVNRIVIDDVSNSFNNQFVTFQNNIPLTAGVSTDEFIEQIDIDGDITDTVDDGNGDLSVEVNLGASIVNLRANILTDGGTVNFPTASVNLNGAADVTIDTDEAGGSQNAGSVGLREIGGPRGLTIDAVADGGGVGGQVEFFTVGFDPLASFDVSASVIYLAGGYIQTDGDVTLSAAEFVATAIAEIRTQSNPANPGGNVVLDFIEIDLDMQVLRLDTTGTPPGSATLPDGFEKIGTLGNTDVYENADGQLIFVNSSAFPAAPADFGDAPASYGSARHTITGNKTLGTAPDAEASQPDSANADADDTTGTPDDEDGVTTPIVLSRGQNNGTVQLSAPQGGILNAWIDFNDDGDFTDPGEQIATNAPLANGANTVIFAVPADGTGTVETFGRFRVSTVGGLTPTSDAADGEVEDYQVTIQEAPADFGDAPAAWGSAKHTITGNKTLGVNRDAEAANQPNGTATGDDVTGTPDDEDGVTLPAGLSRGQNSSVTVNAPQGGVLNAWIDFNADNDFADAGEQIATDAPLASGNNTLIFAVPSVGTGPVNSYARFRVSTLGGLTPTSDAADGEVEDYQVTIQDAAITADFGDAPATYGSARHTITGNKMLGVNRDGEAANQPNATATGDDVTGTPDDEDGVTTPISLTRGQSNSTVTLSAPQGGFLNAWIDYNDDGDFLDAGEQIATDAPLSNGSNTVTFAVPAGGTGTVETFARFRVSTVGGLTPTSDAADGEVEDYQVTIQAAPADFGDAPATYGSARHTITGNKTLGVNRDAEAANQPNATATGDDTTGTPDDEDGVTVPASLNRGQSGSVTVNAPNGGVLNAWIDFNDDDDFLDAGEQIATDAPLSNGSNTVTFAVPATGSGTVETFARFRVSTVGGLTPTSDAADGEVEDYQVTIQEAPADFGDAPAAWGSAKHTITGNKTLGVNRDAEAANQPNGTATGDDVTGTPDDEDGVTLPAGLSRGQNSSVTVNAPQGGVLNAWIDFNADNDFADAGEQIATDAPLASGNNTLIFAVPSVGTGPVNSYARFRVSTLGGLTPTSDAADGEVEDYQVTIQDAAITADFGDAPATYGSARHTITGNKTLGVNRDGEAANQPNATATGDDVTGTPDDEDGVTTPISLTRGQSNSTVTLSAPQGGFLNAWIDYNDDGDFLDAGEQIATDAPLSNGSNPVTFNVPATGTGTVETFARFRVSTVGGLTPTSDAADGEVEDYQATIQDAAITADFGDAPATYGSARHTITGNKTLGVNRDAEAANQPSATATGDDVTGTPDDEDGVTTPISLTRGQSNSTVTLSAPQGGILNAWIDYNDDGDFLDAGEQIATDSPLSNGSNTVTFNVPATGTGTVETFARFRVSTVGGLTPTSDAADGEVEDYQATIQDAAINTDFGDAPASYGSASHTITGNKTLGANRDAEAANQPGAAANLDDTTGTPDDEDGVTTPISLTRGQSNSTVTLSAPQGGILNAWIDFNDDGDFLDAGEQIATNETLATGNNTIDFPVPSTGAGTVETFGRFRVTTATNTLGPTGLAADGEVEDHSVTIQPENALFEDNFGDGVADGFTPRSGTFTVSGGAYRGERLTAGQNAISTFNITPSLPSRFRIDATVNTTGGNGTSLWSNGLIIFDYVDASNFKYAGAFEIINRYMIGEVINGVDNQGEFVRVPIAPGTDINLSLEINGLTATLSAGGSSVVAQTFAGGSLTDGLLGVGTLNATTIFDNINVTDLT